MNTSERYCVENGVDCRLNHLSASTTGVAPSGSVSYLAATNRSRFRFPKYDARTSIIITAIITATFETKAARRARARAAIALDSCVRACVRTYVRGSRFGALLALASVPPGLLGTVCCISPAEWCQTRAVLPGDCGL
jgi:hypothetical protein